MAESLYDSRVCVVFSIYNHSPDSESERVGVLGLDEYNFGTGQSDIESSSIAEYIGLNEWRLERLVLKNCLVSWRLCLLDYRTQSVVDQESFVRELAVGEDPVHVQAVYGENSYELRTAKSSLSCTGQFASLDSQQLRTEPRREERRRLDSESSQEDSDLDDLLIAITEQNTVPGLLLDTDQATSSTFYAQQSNTVPEAGNSLSVPNTEHETDFENKMAITVGEHEKRSAIPVPTRLNKRRLSIPNKVSGIDFENKLIAVSDDNKEKTIDVPILPQMSVPSAAVDANKGMPLYLTSVTQKPGPKVPLKSKATDTLTVPNSQYRKYFENRLANIPIKVNEEPDTVAPKLPPRGILKKPYGTDVRQANKPLGAFEDYKESPGVRFHFPTKLTPETATKGTSTDPILIQIDDKTNIEYSHIVRAHADKRMVSVGVNTDMSFPRTSYANLTTREVYGNKEKSKIQPGSVGRNTQKTKAAKSKVVREIRDDKDRSDDIDGNILDKLLKYGIPILLVFACLARGFYNSHHS